MIRQPPTSTLFPNTTLFRSGVTVVVPRRDAHALSRFAIHEIDRRCEIVQADILDYESMMRILNEYSVDSVFHLAAQADRKSTRLNSSHANISYAVFCLKKKI